MSLKVLLHSVKCYELKALYILYFKMDVYETDIHVPMRTVLYLFHCLKGTADCLRYYCKIEAIMIIN